VAVRVPFGSRQPGNGSLAIQGDAVGRLGSLETPAVGEAAGADHVETDLFVELGGERVCSLIVGRHRQRPPRIRT